MSAVTGLADNIVGTAGNDLITGPANSLENGESVDGKGGTDTLNALYNLAAAATITPTLKSVENINVSQFSAAQAVTFSLLNSEGYENLMNVNSTGGAAVNFTGIKYAEGANLGVRNNQVAQTTQFAYVDMVGTDNSVSLEINNVSAAQTIDITDGTAANAIKNMMITGTGANVDANGNPVNNILDNDGLGAKNYYFFGTGLADISGAALTQATKIDGSENSGGFSVHSNINDNVTVTGGTGNDSVRFTGGTFNANDVVKLGEGTKDTLSISTADALGITSNNGNLSGINILRLDTGALAGTLNLDRFEGTAGEISQVRLDAGINGGTIKGMTSGDTLRLGAAGTTGTVEVSGTNKELGIHLSAATTGGNISFLTGGGLTAAGVETINIQSNRTAAAPVAGDINTMALTATSAKTINVTGDTNTVLGNLGANVTSVTSEIATNFVATAGLTATLTGGAGSSATVTTGAGNDVIVSGAGNDVIKTGAGVDTVTIGTGNVNVDLGDGNDTLIITGADQLTKNDTIDGGAGTDTIRVTGAVTFADDNFTNVTNFERADIQGAVTVNFNLGTNAANAFTGKVVHITNTTNDATASNINATSFASDTILKAQMGTNAASHTIAGGAGNDVIFGGAGADSLTGGGGADKFAFRDRADIVNTGIGGGNTNSANMTKITDFSAGVDKIVIGVTGGAFSGGGVTFTGATTVNMNAVVNIATAADIADIQTAVGAGALLQSTAGTAQAVVAVVAAGAMQGSYLIIDSGQEAGFLVAQDAIINITGVAGTLSGTDFQFATIDSLFA